jgi:hypothetical protein
MASYNRQAEYLAKAKDAEERAARATDEETRASWTQIAENYRALARRYVELQKKGSVSLTRFNPGERHQR